MESIIDVYPAFDVYYYGYYLRGILDIFKKSSIKYTINDFPKFSQRCLAFKYKPTNLNIYIDAEDSDLIDSKGLDWCKIYGKVNINPNKMPNHHNKVRPIEPSFGIKIWNSFSTLLNAYQTYKNCNTNKINIYQHFYNYWRHLTNRLELYEYKPGYSDPNYIFFLSSIWAPDDECNNYRLKFIQVANKIEWIKFEGGFAPPSRYDVTGLEKYTINNRYSIRKYINKIKRSSVVFNTPAVLNCQGWKLGEYLALGKAIISTPLKRTIPIPLIHGKHVHFIDGSSESIKNAIYLICKNNNYRKYLEQNALEYFLKNMSAKKVINELISNN